MQSESWHAPRYYLMLLLRQSENAHDLAVNVQGPPGLGNVQAETHGTKHEKQFRYIHGGSITTFLAHLTVMLQMVATHFRAQEML